MIVIYFLLSLINKFQVAEAYLEPSQKLTMEHFYENSG